MSIELFKMGFKWKGCPLDVKISRSADVESDLRFPVAIIRMRICVTKRFKQYWKRKQYDIQKL